MALARIKFYKPHALSTQMSTIMYIYLSPSDAIRTPKGFTVL